MIGTPLGASGMGTVRNIIKTTTGFTVEFYEPLGTGTEGFFDWILVR